MNAGCVQMLKWNESIGNKLVQTKKKKTNKLKNKCVSDVQNIISIKLKYELRCMDVR